MAKLKVFNKDRVREKRLKSGMNQSAFWTRYGISQSGGSRYETGRNIPTPAAMLIWLHEVGRISDKDLGEALKAVS